MKINSWFSIFVTGFFMLASCGNGPSSTQCGASGQICCNAGACNQGLSCSNGICTGGPGPGPSRCNGDFTLGKNFITNSNTDLGTACDKDPPTNCPDGTFVKFNGNCYCTVACSSFQTTHNPGDNCTSDGMWVCQHVLATNASMNEDVICTPKEWNLCSK